VYVGDLGERRRAVPLVDRQQQRSLRDIETCLSVQASKLYSIGFRDPVRRLTLADANEARDWRIYAELAQRLIVQARRVYVNEDLGFDLANTVYALDSTTIDLCLAVFPSRKCGRRCPRVSIQRICARSVAPGAGGNQSAPPQNFGVKSQPGPPMTLGNAAPPRSGLIDWCKGCQHQVEPDPAEMAARNGAERPSPMDANR
jgi:hypothetical protein